MDKDSILEELKRDEQIKQTIKQVDTEINELYNNLEVLSVEPSPNLQKQNKLIKEIERLQSLKSSLYNNLSSSYTSVQNNVSEARNALVDEVAISGVIKHELSNAENSLEALKDKRFNKLRMTEINDYYSEKYRTQTKVMKTIVYFCVPILVLGILTKNELIPQNIGLGIIGILIGLAIMVVLYQVNDIWWRDNMVFDEYDWDWNPKDGANVTRKKNNSKDQPKDPNSSEFILPNCKGEECCPTGNDFGTLWNEKLGKCTTSSYENNQNTDSEGFVGSQCLAGTFNKANEKIDMYSEPKVTPFNGDASFANF
tara:strand:- start:7384 stop:8319 length:936 start_codon:yes stop_codon:yes gene_type:complete